MSRFKILCGREVKYGIRWSFNFNKFAINSIVPSVFDYFFYYEYIFFFESFY